MVTIDWIKHNDLAESLYIKKDDLLLWMEVMEKAGYNVQQIIEEIQKFDPIPKRNEEEGITVKLVKRLNT